MPFGISQQQSDCDTWATVKEETDGTYTTIGCHATKQDAIDQMVVVSMSEEIEPLGEVRAIDVDLSAPEFMRKSAKRGLVLHEEGKSGDGLMPATVADARRMADGTISEAKWRKIGAWISRHIVDLEAVEGDEITAGLVAMLLWGGGSSKASALRAQRYAEQIVTRLDADEIRCTTDEIPTMLTTMTTDATTEQTTTENRWCVTGQDERRIAYTTLEMRESGSGNTLVGYAAVFDSPSEPMPFIEYVKRGAFAKTINDGADVRLLIDHEGVPLARTRSGTLSLMEDDRGLQVTAELDPMNPDAARIISAMRRGDISQMSFAFRTIKDSWSSDRMTRELREVQLFDVSVVTFPAYEETVAELRSKEIPTTVIPTTSVSVRKAQLSLARHR
ncbi:Prohead protease [uncultured Caudovirales phage]|uniref:Prohead protease n=1 Tax=uncultured Caudovirales phage TaxID=2100421 RepID=A0A6J5S6Y2_9CAUD|nr:Prohead protease [uncultured Caudovirales phage]CAB5229756.1 Prohead protease [uncultured Caudovirales phage]